MEPWTREGPSLSAPSLVWRGSSLQHEPDQYEHLIVIISIARLTVLFCVSNIFVIMIQAKVVSGDKMLWRKQPITFKQREHFLAQIIVKVRIFAVGHVVNEYESISLSVNLLQGHVQLKYQCETAAADWLQLPGTPHTAGQSGASPRWARDGSGWTGRWRRRLDLCRAGWWICQGWAPSGAAPSCGQSMSTLPVSCNEKPHVTVTEGPPSSLPTDLMISCCWYSTRALSTLNFLAIKNLTAEGQGSCTCLLLLQFVNK